VTQITYELAMQKEGGRKYIYGAAPAGGTNRVRFGREIGGGCRGDHFSPCRRFSAPGGRAGERRQVKKEGDNLARIFG
jgi:hypothetical protein